MILVKIFTFILYFHLIYSKISLFKVDIDKTFGFLKYGKRLIPINDLFFPLYMKNWNIFLSNQYDYFLKSFIGNGDKVSFESSNIGKFKF